METHLHHLQFYGTRRRMSVARVYRRSRAEQAVACGVIAYAFARHDAACLSHEAPCVRTQNKRLLAACLHTHRGTRRRMSVTRVYRRSRAEQAVACSVLAYAFAGHDTACLSHEAPCVRTQNKRLLAACLHTHSRDTTPHVCHTTPHVCRTRVQAFARRTSGCLRRDCIRIRGTRRRMSVTRSAMRSHAEQAVACSVLAYAFAGHDAACLSHEAPCVRLRDGRHGFEEGLQSVQAHVEAYGGGGYVNVLKTPLHYRT